MGGSYFRKTAVVAVVTLFICLGLLLPQGFPSEKHAQSSRIIDGSTVIFSFQVTVPGEPGFEVNDVEKFVQGRHELPPGLERAVTGMKSGDEKRVELSEEEAFGRYDTGKKKTVPRESLPPWAREGDRLEDRNGKRATVAQLSDTSAVMDYNHPLAGKPLTVKIKILRVDDPS